MNISSREEHALQREERVKEMMTEAAAAFPGWKVRPGNMSTHFYIGPVECEARTARYGNELTHVKASLDRQAWRTGLANKHVVMKWENFLTSAPAWQALREEFLQTDEQLREKAKDDRSIAQQLVERLAESGISSSLLQADERSPVLQLCGLPYSASLTRGIAVHKVPDVAVLHEVALTVRALQVAVQKYIEAIEALRPKFL